MLFKEESSNLVA